MSRKTVRRLHSGMYGDSDMDDTEDTVTQVKTLDRTIKKRKEKPAEDFQKKSSSKSGPFSMPISERLVPCHCNKCGSNINGVLVGYIFSPLGGADYSMCTPFISYECQSCGKRGNRSVLSKALHPDEFDRHYF